MPTAVSSMRSPRASVRPPTTSPSTRRRSAASTSTAVTAAASICPTPRAQQARLGLRRCPPTCPPSATATSPGSGNKDGAYYVVDRPTTGELRLEGDGGQTDRGHRRLRRSVASSVPPPWRPTPTGAWSWPAAPPWGLPCQHGFDAATGEALWQSPESGGTYGAAPRPPPRCRVHRRIDQTLRAYDLATGEVRWSARSSRSRRRALPSPGHARDRRRLPASPAPRRHHRAGCRRSGARAPARRGPAAAVDDDASRGTGGHRACCPRTRPASGPRATSTRFTLKDPPRGARPP